MKIVTATLLLVMLAAQAWSDETTTTAASRPTGVIIAAADASHAAERLQTLIAAETGRKFPIVRPGQERDGAELTFVLGTSATRAEVKALLSADVLPAELSPQGFLISTQSTPSPVIVLGGDADGLRYGIGEFWHSHCRLDGKAVIPIRPLHVVKTPALSKRLFWNWTHCTNWDEDLARVHQTKHVDENGTLEPYLVQPNGFTETFEKVIDFQADHKLNGLILWGFLNDAHGGLESGQRLSRYGKENGVRILPGIGSMGYGGFYFGGNHPYNINTFLPQHPEVRLMVQADGTEMAGTPCPSDPTFQQWLRDGAEWYFETLKDIGGVNLEHGDFFQCRCERCEKLRAQPGNDANYHWDMVQTQLPIVRAGLKRNPDLWCIYACYDGYDAAMQAAPPKFLDQFPEAAITQWTYTKMIADPILNPPGSWPSSLRAPPGTKRSVGLLHQGSHWDVERQWWGRSAQAANAFGGTYSLICELIQQSCRRSLEDGSEGIQLVGQIGDASPQNELNYLALEAFSWNPNLEFDDWIDRELAPLYGGGDLSRRFYRIVSDPTRDAKQLAADLRTAEETAASLTDPRAARRWRNLAAELRRRQALLP